MKKFFSKRINGILTAILIILVGLFCFSLFKNIQYPLLWNDEAATVMYSKSILKYGYPKIVFEGNFLTQIPKIPLNNLIDKNMGASKETIWLASYFAVPFIAIAELTNNLSLITALTRLPFVLLGIIGIFFFGYITTLFLTKKEYRQSAFILFLLISLINIPLTLHLREARYYSLLLFLLGIYWFILVQTIIFSDIQYKYFAIFIPIVSIAILFTYPPAFIPCIVIMYIVSLINKGKVRMPSGIKLLPTVITTIVSIPVFLFFDIFGLARLTSNQFQITIPKMISNLMQIISYLYNDELLISAIITSVIFLYIFYRQKKHNKLTPYISFIFLVLIFSSIYIAVLTRLPYLFTRYYIYLGPLATIITIVGLILSIQILGKKIIFVFLAGIIIYNLLIHNGNEKYRRIEGHLYELTHRYEGPLDVIIPFIQNNIKNPEKLVIATNYEEFSYMYYLKSRITIGYVGINLQEDLKIQPDIIIFRPRWGTDPKVFNDFLKKDKYTRISFPIINYPLNNIPEFHFVYPHQFKTLYAQKDDEKLAIFVREGILNQPRK